MPALNRKGPMGQGPMSGHRMGRCTNFGTNPKKPTIAEDEKSIVVSSYKLKLKR